MKVSIDTRTLQPGDVFIPVKGENFDGHQFIADAVKKGASKVLDVDLAKFAAKYRKKLNCKIIAVTGSAGKTTVKDMLYATLSQKYKVVCSTENQNNEIGVPLNLLHADADTEILILEMAMRNRGEIAYLAKIARPTHAVITNIGKTHIEILKTQYRIALTKAEIFQKAQQWEAPQRFAFLNYNTAHYDLLTSKAQQQNFSVLPFSGHDPIEQNLNLTYLVAHHFGLSEDEIQDGLAQFKPSSHRLHKINLPNQVLLIDDTYNANPDGVRYALQNLKQFAHRRKIFVFGDMLELGDHSEAEHQKIVDVLLDSNVDITFTYGEQAGKIVSPNLSISSFKNKEKLISMLLDEIKPNDVILIKGSRGMKMEEIVERIEQNYV